MIELTPPEFAGVFPLLAGIQQAILPYAVCEGVNVGRVFVDRRDTPRAVLIWTPVGYYCLAGDPVQIPDLADFSRVLTEIFVPASRAGGETGFILLTSMEAWKDRLPTLLPGRTVTEIYRRPFTFDPAWFAAQGDWWAHLPAGFRLLPLDAALAGKVGVPPSWASVADFLARGLGFALLEGDEIASVCISVFACQTGVEIDVHTAENYRRRGLAVITTAALIEACVQRGQLPNWECFWENEPSTRLAGKLGFTALPDYAVYFWEE
jgi:GNAT superfamily N-acetyltransferase